MSWRVILSAVLIAAGVATMYFVDGLMGGLIGSGFFIFMLFLWIVPPNLFERGSKGERGSDPTVNRMSRVLLGVGGGLILSTLTAVFAPGALSWLMIGAGVGIIVWLFLRR